MTLEQFNSMKRIMEFDLSIYLPSMINSGMYNRIQTLELTAYVGASYTHFAKEQNIQVSDIDKLNIKEFLCNFFKNNVRPEISEIEKNAIKKKYEELLNTNRDIIQKFIEKIAELASK
jgi:hypothetical protein